MVLIGRLLEKYGSTRTSKVLIWRAWRRARRELKTVCPMAYFLAERYSAWDDWRLLDSVGDSPDGEASPEQQACRIILGDSMPTQFNGEQDGGALHACARLVFESHQLNDRKQIKTALKQLRQRKKSHPDHRDSYIAELASDRLTALTGVKLSWFGW